MAVNKIGTENLPCVTGNVYLHAITAQKKYSLRFDLTDFNNSANYTSESRYAQYKHFAVANVGDKYRLTLKSYSGTAGKYYAYFVLCCHVMLLCK